MSYKGVKDTIPSAVPTDYDRQTDYSDYEANNPGSNFLGADLDAEFDAIEQAMDETQDRLSIIQRDDGALANESVGADQLKPNITFGFGIVTDWATATPYDLNDGVWFDRRLYRCIESHTSGTFSTDLAAGKWELIADFDQWLTAAESEATDAAADALLAQNWATSTTEVSGGLKGARGYAEDAAGAVANLTTQAIQTTKGCSLVGDAMQVTVTEGTEVLSFSSENYDTDTFHDNGTNPSRVTIPSAYNNYLADFHLEIRLSGSNSSMEYVDVTLTRDGVGIAGNTMRIRDFTDNYTITFKDIELSTGDYYEIFIVNPNGGVGADYIDVAAGATLRARIVSAPVGTDPSTHGMIDSSESFAIGGDFSATGYAKRVRDDTIGGYWVTIHIPTMLHANNDSPDSGAGDVPAAYRPAQGTSRLAGSGSYLSIVSILTSGLIRYSHRDYSGAPDVQDSADGVEITYFNPD